MRNFNCELQIANCAFCLMVLYLKRNAKSRGADARMGLFDGIIIVSDIDGTFLGKQSRLVPRNLERIRWFQENGGQFTIATGREFFIVYPSVPQVEGICNSIEWPAVN